MVNLSRNAKRITALDQALAELLRHPVAVRRLAVLLAERGLGLLPVPLDDGMRHVIWNAQIAEQRRTFTPVSGQAEALADLAAERLANARQREIDAMVWRAIHTEAARRIVDG